MNILAQSIDPSQVELRPATDEDESFLYRLYASTRADELAAWGWDETQQQMFLRLQFTAQRRHYAEFPNQDHQIILRGQTLVGRLLVSHLETEIRLTDIALLPEFRGHGIGSMLIQGLVEKAASDGKSVRLHVEKSNQAQRLYQRLGFRVIGDDGLYWAMEWQPATTQNNNQENTNDA